MKSTRPVLTVLSPATHRPTRHPRGLHHHPPVALRPGPARLAEPRPEPPPDHCQPRPARPYPAGMTGQEPPVTHAELEAVLNSLTALSFRGTLAGQRRLVDQIAPAITALQQAAAHLAQG